MLCKNNDWSLIFFFFFKEVLFLLLKLRRLVPLRSVKHALRFRRTNSLYVVVLPTFTGKKYFALELSKALPYSTDSLFTNEGQKKTGSWREAFNNFATHAGLVSDVNDITAQHKMAALTVAFLQLLNANFKEKQQQQNRMRHWVK